MAQPTEQLINTALLFMELGKLDQARKITIKLMQGHTERLTELSRIELTDTNYSPIMSELNEIQQMIG